MQEKDLTELLRDMSLEEKIGQLVQLSGSYFKEEALVTGNLRALRGGEGVIGQAGSTLGLYGAEKLRALQKRQMEQQPHHIPMLFMLDVIHGFRTIFPCPLGQGASFSPELAEKCAEAAAREAAVSGVHVTFSPMADLVRDARWGRVMESTGEDVFLNGKMAAAMVRGFQGENCGTRDRVAACVKHFAGYGAPVAGREYYNVELSEHTLREDYLPAYREAVKAGCELVMSAFHTWNGIPCSGNSWLLREVLRDEMGFEGVLISDWGAVGEMIAHGFCEDEEEAAAKALAAGTDIDMCSNAYAEQLAEAVHAGKVSEMLVDEAVLRVLRLKNRLGLFENPYKDGDGEREKTVILCGEHRELAREAVRKSVVLLKNEESILPLRARKIAFIGPYTEEEDMDSAWAVTGRREDQVSIRRAAEEALTECELTFAKGCTLLDNRTAGTRYYYETPEAEWQEENARRLRAAEDAAKGAEVIVLCLGEHRAQSGEAASRADIRLPKVQLELLWHMAALGKPVVTVIFSGRPLLLKEVSELSDAVLMAWFPGTEGGHGIMDVLTGTYNPSAKLPMCVPYSVGQLPMSYDSYTTGRPRRNDTPGGYVSGYLDVPNEPMYPFGYGLSYTEFSLSEPEVEKETLTAGETLGVTAWLENVGTVAGTETVQLYIRDLVADRVRPVKQLKGFQQITLQPGERRRVHFEITEEMLRFHRADGSFSSQPGSFRVWIENSSRTREGAAFELL